MESAKGFFEALFDFSFTSFVTSKLVKLLYALAIVAAALGALVWRPSVPRQCSACWRSSLVPLSSS